MANFSLSCSTVKIFILREKNHGFIEEKKQKKQYFWSSKGSIIVISVNLSNCSTEFSIFPSFYHKK